MNTKKHENQITREHSNMSTFGLLASFIGYRDPGKTIDITIGAVVSSTPALETTAFRGRLFSERLASYEEF